MLLMEETKIKLFNVKNKQGEAATERNNILWEKYNFIIEGQASFIFFTNTSCGDM